MRRPVSDAAIGTLNERLAGKALLLTGASGFVGKAVLAQCLRELPDLGRLTVLLRAPDDGAAAQRLANDVLGSDAFEGLDPEPVTALAGDVAAEGLGGIDVVIHCAASVSFE